MKRYTIAGHIVEIDGEEQYIPPEFQAFLYDNWNEAADVKWTIEMGQPFCKGAGTMLLHNEYIEVYENADMQWLLYPMYSFSLQMKIDKSKSLGTIFLKLNGETPKQVQNSVLYAMRDAFFQKVQLNGMVAVHSATILYHERAYIFSGCSGTGKTTHTNMWMDTYKTPMLDGDVCICSVEGDKVFVYGLPWCGTSGQYMNKKAELGGIVFLQQYPENQVEVLGRFESILRIAARCLTPNWSQTMMDYNLKEATRISELVPCYLLKNRPEKEAMELIRKQFDTYSDKISS